MLRCGTAAGPTPDADLLSTDHFVHALKSTSFREARMATSHAAAPAAATAAKSDRQPNSTGALACALVVVVAMGSLWLGLSGLMHPDHAGGLARTLGGVAGFFAVFALTLVAAARQK
jgi:hypothetical protein